MTHLTRHHNLNLRCIKSADPRQSILISFDISIHCRLRNCRGGEINHGLQTWVQDGKMLGLPTSRQGLSEPAVSSNRSDSPQFKSIRVQIVVTYLNAHARHEPPQEHFVERLLDGVQRSRTPRPPSPPGGARRAGLAGPMGAATWRIAAGQAAAGALGAASPGP